MQEEFHFLATRYNYIDRKLLVQICMLRGILVPDERLLCVEGANALKHGHQCRRNMPWEDATNRSFRNQSEGIVFGCARELKPGD